MMKRLFTGVCTALVTPFCHGSFSPSDLQALIERQLEAGVAALCVLGTTGEAVTLTDCERDRVISTAVDAVHGRVPVIAGVGSPDTARAAAYASRARILGADGMLLVTPYYNKGTHDGIVRHYFTVAEAGGKPLIAYNVPARTGVCLTPTQLLTLSEHPLIAGLKEASDSTDRLVELLCLLSGKLPLYSGNDAQNAPVVLMGGAGTVSVLSNLFPHACVSLYRHAAAGNSMEAMRLTAAYLPLIRALFADTNPVPIKCAMELAGLCSAEVRLPLTPAGSDLRERLKSLLQTCPQP